MNYTGIFDSHAHYDDLAFEENRQEVLQAMFAGGVEKVTNIGADLASSRRSVELAAQYPGVYAAVGVHPHEAKTYNSAVEAELEKLAGEKKVVAIGEIGLDYHGDFSPQETQKAAFEAQLILARRLNLPVVIHSREATADVLALLSAYRPAGVVHCFSGGAETARQILALGMYIGFTGVVTFKNARKVIDALAAVPMDRLLLETDCPYMAPEPFRGRPSNSLMIGQIAEKIGEIKGFTAQEVIDQGAKNAKRLYQIGEEN